MINFFWFQQKSSRIVAIYLKKVLSSVLVYLLLSVTLSDKRWCLIVSFSQPWIFRPKQITKIKMISPINIICHGNVLAAVSKCCMSRTWETSASWLGYLMIEQMLTYWTTFLVQFTLKTCQTDLRPESHMKQIFRVKWGFGRLYAPLYT